MIFLNDVNCVRREDSGFHRECFIFALKLCEFTDQIENREAIYNYNAPLKYYKAIP